MVRKLPDERKIYRVKPCGPHTCNNDPCPFGEGNVGREVRLSAYEGRIYAEPADPDDVKLNWRGIVFCPGTPGHTPICVTSYWNCGHFEEVYKGVSGDRCPSCGTEGSWAACAMKCPKCWLTW
jgi:hypothetical protein